MDSQPLSRRSLLNGAVDGSLVISSLDVVGAKSVASRAGLIAQENERPGTTDWQLSRTRIDPDTNYRCPWIEGFCSHTRIRAGETLRFFVSTNPASAISLDASP